MIEYLELINKIKDVKEECIVDFNKYVSIPLELSVLESKIKTENENIIIKKNNIEYTLDSEVRKSFYEVLYILKKIDKELFNKIDYKYIDFFEKFKASSYEFSFENFDEAELKYLSVEILTIFNIKFWCIDDEDRRNFLDNLKPRIKMIEKSIKNDAEIEENIEEVEESQIIKTNWWIRFINRIRRILKK